MKRSKKIQLLIWISGFSFGVAATLFLLIFTNQLV